MNNAYAILALLVACSLSGCASLHDYRRFDSRVELRWNYDYSSDVIHGELLENRVVASNGDKCHVQVSVIRVVESFKGDLKQGDTFNTVGESAHDYSQVGSEHFLLLKPFVATDHPGYGECRNEDHVDFRAVHHWCCSIEKNADSMFVMYDMANSETRNDTYMLRVLPVFEKLRKWARKSR
jgi:hypothetical protein